MTNQLRLIVDDNDGEFIYAGGQWTLSTLSQWYSRTTNFPQFAESTTVFASFTLEFEGTQIGFIGNTPSPNFPQFITVTIDGGSPVNTSYTGNLPPQAYVQWYQTPVLSDGKHTIQVDHIAGTSLDMAIVTVGPNTSLANKTVFVDDLDSSLQYTGSWVRDNSGINAGSLPDALPIGGTTHRSSTVGDSATFRFTGTSIAVYGVFSWTNLGLLSASFSLDGNVMSQSYPVNTGSPEYVSANGEDMNFLFYSNASIPAGDHTLVMSITEADSITFILDYITYTPSFTTLADMPNLPPVPSSSSPSVLGSSLTASSPSSASNTARVSQTTSQSQPAPIGAIVGAASGGIALILVMMALFFLRLRKQRRVQSELEAQVEQHLPNIIERSHSAPQQEPSATWPSNPSMVSDNHITPFLNFTLSPSATTNDSKRKRAGSYHRIQESVGESSSTSTTSNTHIAGSSHSGPSSRVSQVRSDTTDRLDTVADLGPPAYES